MSRLQAVKNEGSYGLPIAQRPPLEEATSRPNLHKNKKSKSSSKDKYVPAFFNGRYVRKVKTKEWFPTIAAPRLVRAQTLEGKEVGAYLDRRQQSTFLSDARTDEQKKLDEHLRRHQQ